MNKGERKGADLPPEEVLRQAREVGHSYFPVARGDLDDLLGIAPIKEAWARQASGEPADLLGSLRPSPLVSEGAPATDALEAFKRSGLPVTLVIDERGHIEGLLRGAPHPEGCPRGAGRRGARG